MSPIAQTRGWPAFGLAWILLLNECLLAYVLVGMGVGTRRIAPVRPLPGICYVFCVYFGRCFAYICGLCRP